MINGVNVGSLGPVITAYLSGTRMGQRLRGADVEETGFKSAQGDTVTV